MDLVFGNLLLLIDYLCQWCPVNIKKQKKTKLILISFKKLKGLSVSFTHCGQICHSRGTVIPLGMLCTAVCCCTALYWKILHFVAKIRWAIPKKFKKQGNGPIFDHCVRKWVWQPFWQLCMEGKLLYFWLFMRPAHIIVAAW